MTNNEAIKLFEGEIRNFKELKNYESKDVQEYVAAMSMAIEALKMQPLIEKFQKLDDSEKFARLLAMVGDQELFDKNYAADCDPNVVKMLKFGIEATNGKDGYSTGMRNGIKWALSVITNEEPDFDSVEVQDDRSGQKDI